MIEENRWTDVGICFNKEVDALETKMTFLSKIGSIHEAIIACGRNLEAKLFDKNVSLNSNFRYELTITVLKVISLNYRIKASRGGLSPLKDSTDTSVLEAVFLKWKAGTLFPDKKLSLSDKTKIQDLAKYEKFVNVLLQNERALDESFKLIFRDNFPIKILVQYFKTCSIDLKNSLLTIRVGFFKKYNIEVLKIEKIPLQNDAKEKDLQFKINGEFVSILNDDANIDLNGGISLKWGEIKKKWQMKRLPATMEVFQDDGMLAFRPQKLKTYHDGQEIALNTKEARFWEKLPTFLTISKQELEQMFKIVITNDKPCVVTIEASCLEPYHTDNAHGASTVYYPIGNDLYRVYPFGKYAKDFPQTQWQEACFVGNSVEAEFTYPDPTPFYSQRIHGAAPHLLSIEDTEDLMTKYGRDIWNFQFSGNNCSADFQMIFENKFGKKEDGGLIPNYFRHPLLESKFSFPLNYIFGIIALFQRTIAYLLVHLVHRFFWSKREYSRTLDDGTKETVSLYENKEFRVNQNLYNPSMLIHRIGTGEIPGITWFGV